MLTKFQRLPVPVQHRTSAPLLTNEGADRTYSWCSDVYKSCTSNERTNAGMICQILT